MSTRAALIGPILLAATAVTTAFGQSQGFRPANTYLGRLRGIGTVGSTSVTSRFGLVGGANSDLRSVPNRMRSFGTPRVSPSLRIGNRRRASAFAEPAGRLTSPNSFRFRSRNRLGTLDSNRVGPRYYSRPDVLRRRLRALPFGSNSARTGPSRPMLSIRTPVEQILDSRNMLRARSPLSQAAQSYRVLDALSPSPSAPSFYPGSAPPTLEAGGLTVQDYLERQLEERRQRFYRRAILHFQVGEMTDADNALRTAKTLDRNNIRFYVADVLIAHERNALNRAAASLIRALTLFSKAMTKLEDRRDDQSIDSEEFDREAAALLDALRIPRWDGDPVADDDLFFYQDSDAFERVVDRVNVRAARASTRAAGGTAQLLLVYFSWLSEEHTAAMDAARRAESLLLGEAREAVEYFREFLAGRS